MKLPKGVFEREDEIGRSRSLYYSLILSSSSVSSVVVAISSVIVVAVVSAVVVSKRGRTKNIKMIC